MPSPERTVRSICICSLRETQSQQTGSHTHTDYCITDTVSLPRASVAVNNRRREGQAIVMVAGVVSKAYKIKRSHVTLY